MPKLRVGQPGKGDNRRRAYLGLRLRPEADDQSWTCKDNENYEPTMTKCPCVLCVPCGIAPLAHATHAFAAIVVLGFSLGDGLIRARAQDARVRSHRGSWIPLGGVVAGIVARLARQIRRRQPSPHGELFHQPKWDRRSGGAPSRRPAETREEER